MVEKKVDVGWIIYTSDNILESVRSSKGIWFLPIITELCTHLGVIVDKNEKKTKVRRAITARALTDA